MAREIQIQYSDKYYDDSHYEYRHVVLPANIAAHLPPGRLLSEQEWRQLGVQQSRGWIHYHIHKPEPHILLFRRALTPEAASIAQQQQQQQELLQQQQIMQLRMQQQAAQQQAAYQQQQQQLNQQQQQQQQQQFFDPGQYVDNTQFVDNTLGRV